MMNSMLETFPSSMNQYVTNIKTDQLNAEKRFRTFKIDGKYPMGNNVNRIAKDEIIETLYQDFENGKIDWLRMVNDYRELSNPLNYISDGEEDVSDEEI